MTLAAGTRLGPYEIRSPLGAGGMGEVYRARDTKLDRDVAVKVLPQSVAGDPDTLARFEREAKVVAALSHPNILAIHDFGVHDGHTYAVMELLEGELLQDKLQAPISQKQAVEYAVQIAKGLAAAHEKGIVHRDLKPANLFVTKAGHLKILDFGLAKRVAVVAQGGETGAPTVSGLTEPGRVMGTVGYMSPEQVRGLAVDQRSDIFSFGAILYELLSGKRAFSRPTVSDTMAAIMRDEPPRLSESERNIPVALDHIVRHCLEKDPENRFQSARDIAFDLSEVSGPSVVSGLRAAATAGMRWILVATAVLTVFALVGLFVLRHSNKGPSETAGVKRVAVLPFENLGAAEDDYFVDGIADEVRGKLTSLSGLQVIARRSSTPYKKSNKTPKQIAQELNASYLLSATVRWEKSGGTSRVHVSPELVDVTRSDAPTSRWQQPFEATLTDVFQVQSDIASRVAQALGVVIGAGEEKRLAEKPTQNLAAYDAFLKGEEVWKAGWTLSTVRRVLGFCDQAVALDPNFAQAWARVSMASSILYSSAPTPALAERARQAAAKAVALAPSQPEGYLALGFYQVRVPKDFSRGLEQYTEGQRVAPGNADLLAWAGHAEMFLGRWDASLQHAKQAQHLDPRSVDTQVLLGLPSLFLRRYAEARKAYEQGLALAPTDLEVRWLMAMTFLGEGDLAGARAVLKAAPKEVESTALVAWMADSWDLVWILDDAERELLVRLTPSQFDDNKARWAICLAQAYALKGDAASVRDYAEEAREVFEEQLHAAPDDARLHTALGLSLAYRGRKEEAIREGLRGVALAPVAKDAFVGPYLQHQLVRIYMLVGEPEKAIAQLEPLLKIPYYLSAAWIQIDPNFDPLRKNPRFQKLVAGAGDRAGFAGAQSTP